MKGFKRNLLFAAVVSALGGAAHAASTIDMVVAIDESGSMSGEHNQFIGSYIENLDNVLNAQSVTVNRYGLGGFGGGSYQGTSANEAGRETSSSALYRHLDLSSGVDAVWGDAAEFKLVTPQLDTSGGTEDGYRMIDYVLRNYQFRNNAGASILLITDEDRDVDTGGTPVTSGLPQGQTIYDTNTANNTATMQQMLAQKHIVLHSVVNQRFTDSQGRTAIAIVGADPATGFAFVKDPVTGVVSKVQGYAIVPNSSSSIAATTEADYTKLSLATGGTVMDIEQLRSVYHDLTALGSLSQELAKIVAAISQGQGTVVGIDCSVATGQAARLCRALGQTSNNSLQALLPSGSAAAVRAGLGQMLPHSIMAARSSIIHGTAQYRRQIFSRLAKIRGNYNPSAQHISLAPTPMGATGLSGGAASADDMDDSGFFIRGSYGEARQSSDDGINGYRSDTYSVAVGADRRINSKLLLGASFGYVHGDSDVRGMSGTGSENSMYMLSGFGSYEFSPSWFVEGMLGYGRVVIDTQRTVAGTRLSGDTHANQWNLSVGLAKEIALNEATTLRPFGQLHYTNVAIDGYREKGGAPALLYKDNTIDSLVSEIGLAAERKLNNGWSVNGSLAWEHEFSNDSRSIRTAFVADPANTVFRVKGVDGQRDYGRVAVGVSKEIDRDRSFFVNLDGVVGNSDYRDYTLEFKYRQSF